MVYALELDSLDLTLSITTHTQWELGSAAWSPQVPSLLNGICLSIFVCMFLVSQSYLTLCNPMDCIPWGSSVHGDSPGKNTRVGCHALLQGIFQTEGLNLGLVHCRWILYCLSHQKPAILCNIKWEKMGFPGDTSGKECTCQCRRHKRHRFHPRVGKIPWKRAWQPAPVFLPGESREQRSLVGYSPWHHKELDTTDVT